jgi:hypothetical protein
MDCAASLRPLADAIAERTGRQVYIFLYDDAGRYLDRTGDDLARALVDLCDALGERGRRPPLRVVAHAMGGIVARCAMSSLVDPAWFPEMSADPGAPAPLRGTSPEEVKGIRLERARPDAFARVDLVAIDTPWHGFTDLRVEVRNRMEREASYVDMVAGSALYAALHATALPATFTINHIEADNLAAGESPDKVVGLGELSEESVPALARYFAGDASALDAELRLKNQILSFQDEADFSEVEPSLRRAAIAGELTRERFQELVASAVPKLPGSHVSVLSHPRLFEELERTFARYST